MPITFSTLSPDDLEELVNDMLAAVEEGPHAFRTMLYEWERSLEIMNDPLLNLRFQDTREAFWQK